MKTAEVAATDERAHGLYKIPSTSPTSSKTSRVHWSSLQAVATELRTYCASLELTLNEIESAQNYVASCVEQSAP